MKLSLKHQLAILLLAPFLVVIFFIWQTIINQMQSINFLKQNYIKQEKAIYLSNIIHELQKERDYAIVYSSNPLVENQIQLEDQFYHTDSIFDKYYGLNKNDLFLEVDTSALKKERNQLTWLFNSPTESENFYNTFIDVLLDKIHDLQKDITLNPLRSSYALLQSKEYFARIRNRVYEALMFREFSDKNFAYFTLYKGAFELGLKDFKKYANKDVIESFELNFKSGSSSETLKIIDDFFHNKSISNLYISTDSWWLNATNFINLLHQNQINIHTNIQQNFANQLHLKQKKLNQLYLKTGLLILILILLWWAIIYQINNRINIIKQKANKLSLGDTSGDIYFSQKDSISDLAKSLNKLSKSAENFAKLASTIGAGNYENSIKIRSKEDVLGNALEEMRKNLFFSENELKLKYNELEGAYSHKSIFLANISHELRTPLNSIVILAQLLNESKNLSKDEIKYSIQISKSASNLMELINDILDYSKVELGKENTYLHETNLDVLIHEIANIFNPLAKEKNIKLEFSKDLSQETYITDSIKLGQILKNLVSNAIKFTPINGLVFCSIKEKNNCLEIIIKDSGIGISFENQSKIFSPFFQVEDNLHKSVKGTGLGLSIVKELVLLLNGNIQIQSDINQGTTFTVILPLKLDEKIEKTIVKEVKSDEIIQEKNKNNINEITIEPEIINLLKNKKVLLIHKDILTAFDFVNILNSNKIEVYLATEQSEIEEIIKIQKIDSKLEYKENSWVIIPIKD